MKKRLKKAQTTIFVLVAILLVVAIFLVFLLYERTSLNSKPSATEEPQEFINYCIELHLEEVTDLIIENGGYVEIPELSKDYLGKEVPYLCYIADNNEKCQPQEPVLIEHLEEEIHNYILEKAKDCFIELETEFERKGYEFSLGDDFELIIELKPRKAKAEIRRELNYERVEVEKKFDSFNSEVQTPLYDLGVIVHKIIRQEARYCNSDYITMMAVDPWVEIDKFQTGDDEKVYTLEDLKTKKSWRFALRNCVLDTPS